MEGKIRGKKGNFVLDIGLIMIIVFFLGLMLITLRLVYTPIDNVIQGIEDNGASDEIQADHSAMTNNQTTVFDWLYLLVLVSLAITLWVSVWFIDTHPVFFIVVFIFIILYALVSMALSNSFTSLLTDNSLSPTAQQFIIMPFIMNNIVAIMIGIGFITGILLFAKTRGGGQ